MMQPTVGGNLLAHFSALRSAVWLKVYQHITMLPQLKTDTLQFLGFPFLVTALHQNSDISLSSFLLLLELDVHFMLL